MNEKRAAVSEAVGVLVIYAAASFLHFCYALSGGSPLAALFGAVNESVWEHVKVFSAAYSGYALLQLLWLRPPFSRYVAAKCCGLILLMGGMIGFYYLYTALTGGNILLVDLIYSAVLTALSQYVSYRLTVGSSRIGELFCPALMLIMLYYIMFFSFTVAPPRLGLFRDPVTGGCGIPAQTAQPTYTERDGLNRAENSLFF